MLKIEYLMFVKFGFRFYFVAGDTENEWNIQYMTVAGYVSI